MKLVTTCFNLLRPSGKPFKYLWRVLPYLKPHWKLAFVSVALIVLSSLFSLLVPWPLKFLIDSVLQNIPLPEYLAALLGDNRTVWLYSAVGAGLLFTVIQHLLTVLDNYVNTKIDQSMVLDFRSDLFQHAQRLSLAFHDQRRSGMLIYAINFQGEAAARLIMTIPAMAQSLLTLVAMFVILFLMAPVLAILSLFVLPFLYYSVGFYVRKIEPRLSHVRAMEGESLSIIHEAIAMLRVIVAFGREDHEYQRFRQQGEKCVAARVKVTVFQTIFSLVVDLITGTGTAILLVVGAHLVLAEELTVGDLTVILYYLAQVYKPLEAISHTIGSLQDVFMSLQVAFNLLDTEPEIKDAPGAISIESVRGDISFDSVNFHYRDRVDTLRDISFDVKAGQVIAIVGPTGAGKTTLVSLLPRFYGAQQGVIRLDGTDSRLLTLESLRRQISIVLQEPLLFSGTIADNIRYGKLGAGMDEIVAAAKAANAHDFIMNLPSKYETDLGERGVQLSGGERQRIAVARAFLKNAPILILDEPTSSIDSRTEAVILDALDRLMIGRTTFMIAHRLSTVRRADFIVVMDQGRVVESGSHQELLQLGGLYRQLHEMQNRQSEGASAEEDVHS